MPDPRKVGFLGKKMGYVWTKLRSTKKKDPDIVETFRNWCYRKSYFPELGLMYDDIRYMSPEVKEALKRLPPHIVDERTFRIDRALQLSARKQVLPKDEWMTRQQDTFYMADVLEQVKEEMKEKKEWQRK